MKRRDFIKASAGFGAALVTTKPLSSACAQTKSVFKASDVQPAGYPTVAATEESGQETRSGDQRAALGPDVSVDAARRREGNHRADANRRDPNSARQRGLHGTDRRRHQRRQHALPVQEHGACGKDDGRSDRPGIARQDHGQRRTPTWSRCAGWMPARAASTTPSSPIKSIEDIKGLKFRVIGNPIFIDMMNALGGNGVAMGYDQVFSALQTGVIDGAENNPPSYVFSNHYTAAKYFSLTEHLDHSRGAGVFEASLGCAFRRRSEPDQEVCPRSPDGRTRALEQVRAAGDGKGQGCRLPDRRNRRQDAVPERGQAGVGQIRPEIPGHDQAHPGYRRRHHALSGNAWQRSAQGNGWNRFAERWTICICCASSSAASRWC